MTRIQQSVEIAVPARVAYNQLTQFEEYPQFMQDVESVQQLDDSHLHWVTKVSDRQVEWDAEITEQVPDRYIAWHNTSGPASTGKVAVEPVGAEAARVTLTLETAADNAPGTSGASDAVDGSGTAAISERLGQDLARLKQFLEERGAETGAWRGEVRDGQPVHSDAGTAAASRRDASTQSRSTQSDYALSQPSSNEDEDGRFSIAEEVSFDMQSDAARRVGQAPEQDSNAAEGMEQAIKRDAQEQQQNRGA